MIRPFLSLRSLILSLIAVSILAQRQLHAQPIPTNIPDRERCAATEGRSPFAIDYYYDLALGLGSVSLTVTGLIMEHRVEGWMGQFFEGRRLFDLESFVFLK